MNRLLIMLFLGLFAVCSSAQVFPERPTVRIENALTTWTIPDAREDGTPLAPEEIKGFEIYLFDTARTLGTERVINIPNGAQTSHEITDLAPGDYTAAIAAYDTTDLYSKPSDPVFFSITRTTGPASPALQIQTSAFLLSGAVEWCIDSEDCSLEINIAIR